MTPSRSLAAAAVLTALCASPVAAQDAEAKHLLRYRFQKGAVGHYSIAQAAKIKIKVGDRDIDSTMNMEMFMSFEVADVKDGAAVMHTKVRRVKMKMANPMGGDIEFDTVDEDSVPAMFDSILDGIDQNIEFSVDDRGQIKGVEMPAAMKQAAQTGLDLEQMFQRFMMAFPEEPVAIGEVWKTEMSQKLGQGGQIAMDVDNQVLSVQGNEVTIGMKMKVDLDGPQFPGEIEIKDATSKLTIDMGTGLQKGMEMGMKVAMSMNQGGMAMDMNMDVTQTIKPVAAPESGKSDKNEKK